MDDVRVVEAAEDVLDRVSLPDVCKELASESFIFACSLHESGDVYDLHSCRDHSLWVAEALEHFKSLVRNDGGADVRLDRAEREVCALCLSRTYTVEQC